MGFFDNFSRDYFNTGINKTFRSTLGNILSGYKTKGLLDWITGNKDKQSTDGTTPNKEQPSYDSIFRRKDGNPMQDLDVQPKPVYSEPPNAGGFPNSDSGTPTEEELLQQLAEDKPTQTEQPVEDSSYILQQVASQNEVPLLKGKDKNKVTPNILLKDVMGDREGFNNDLMKRVLETQLYNSRFGDVAKPYNDITSSVLQGYYQHAPTEPKFDKNKMFSDAQGNLYQYKYNFYTGTYDAVPVAGDNQQQIQTDLPKFDEKRIQVTQDKDGNAVLFDMQSQKSINTGVPYTNFDPYYALKERDISLDEAYKMGMLDIAQAKLLMSQSKGNRGDGSSDGTGSNGVMLNPNTKQLEVDGVPLEPMEQQVQTGRFIKGEDGKIQPEYKTERGYKINGKFVDMADIDKIVGQVGKKGLTPYQLKQLEFYGIGVDKGGNFIDKEKTTNKKKENDWNGLWNLQLKRAQNPKDPLNKQAVEWLQDPKNQEYARRLNLLK